MRIRRRAAGGGQAIRFKPLIPARAETAARKPPTETAAVIRKVVPVQRPAISAASDPH